MRLTIEHQTRYEYQSTVRRSTQYLRLTPQPSRRQRILSWELELPESATVITSYSIHYTKLYETQILSSLPVAADLHPQQRHHHLLPASRLHQLRGAKRPPDRAAGAADGVSV